MLAAWRTVVTDQDTTVPDDAGELAAAARADTPLPSAGLSARAISALEPLRLDTVGDLAAVDPVLLSRLSGVAEPTRREVRARAKQWRGRFGDAREPDRHHRGAAAGGPGAPGGAAAWAADDPLADPVATAEMLVRVARTPSRQQCARRMLGLAGAGDHPVDTFATVAELAPGLGLGGQPQVSRMLAALQEAWAADPDATAGLDAALGRAVEVLAGLGGLTTVEDLVAMLSAGAAEPGTGHAGASAGRVTAGLLRFALDRADIIERGGGDSPPIARRRRRDGRSQLVATAPELLEVADTLGRCADDLVAAATAAGEDVAPVGRAAGRLQAVWPPEVPVPDQLRLVRLAARLSTRAGASRRGELHDRGLPPAAALVIALGGLAPSQRLTVRDLAERVRARFPDLPALPGRPRLDRVVSDAKLPMQWDGEAYAVPSRTAGTSLASRASVVAVPVVSGEQAATSEDARLAGSVASRGFLALGVPAGRLDPAARTLVDRHRAQIVDVTAVLLDALREQARRRGVPWDAVRAADAAEPGSRPAQGLAALVRDAVPAVETAVAEAAGGAPEGTRPVLLVEAAPLARYGHTGLLTRLADLTRRRRQAVWLLLPEEPGAGAELDGVPLRLSHGGQFLRLDDTWLRQPAEPVDSTQVAD
jgi:hypothetical protein